MWFVLIFFGIYSGMHAYLFWKVHQALPHMGKLALLLAAFFVLMIFGPFLVRLLDRAFHFRAAAALAAVAYSWIAILFWFCCLFVAADAWNVLIRLAALAWPAARHALLPPGVALASLGVMILLAAGWAYFEAHRIGLRRVTISTAAIPRGEKPITIAMISDMHLGDNSGRSRLRQVIEIVREARPDVLISDGDILDSPRQGLADAAQALEALRPPLGKFAVFGNHEFYAGVDNSTAFIESAGFRLLRQDRAEVNGHLVIAGVDDPAGGPFGHDRTNEDAVLPEEENGKFRILLKHRPDVRQQSLGRFDLQLSGHTHGGQLFPFMAVVNMVFPYGPGLHELAGGSQLYVSRGTGTWGPAMRLFAPPEVTIIRLEAR